MILENENIRLIIAIVASFAMTYISIPSIVRVANIKHLFDEPGKRASHSNKVPTLGGLAIFAGFSVSSLIFVNLPELKYIIAGIIILFFVGIKDDILVIAPLTKLLGQIFSATVIIMFTDIEITNIHGLFGINDIPRYIGIPLTVFTIIVITNGFNLIDGIDGLSASIGSLVTGTLGYWFYRTGHIELTIISLSLIGALLAFLRFNLYSYQRKIFMGDTGSLIIGLIISILIIKFNQINTEHNFELSIWGAPAVSFGILILPLFDTLRVMFIRLCTGKGMFRPDKNHIHHKLLDLGLTHKKATFILIITNVIFIILAFCLNQILRTRTLLLVLFLLAMIIFYIPTFLKRKKEKEFEI